MSRFYAEIEGNRGIATRQGTLSSGIRGHIRGWDLGVSVYGEVTKEGKDSFYINVTRGSNNSSTVESIAMVYENEKGDIEILVANKRFVYSRYNEKLEILPFQEDYEFQTDPVR